MKASGKRRALETDTLCGNVTGPFWFAHPAAATGSIGQGSLTAAPQSALFSVKRSSSCWISLSVDHQHCTEFLHITPRACRYTPDVWGLWTCSCKQCAGKVLCQLLVQNKKEGRRDVAVVTNQCMEEICWAAKLPRWFETRENDSSWKMMNSHCH